MSYIMKKLMLLLTVLALVFVCALGAVAETTEAPAETTETAETVAEATEAVEETAEAVTAEPTDAAEETAEAAAEATEAVEATADAATAETTEAVEETTEEPAEEKKESWTDFAFGKLGKLQWYVWTMLVILLVFGVIMSLGTKRGMSTRRLAFGAMCIAISFILSMIRLYRMPQGGSITLLSKLPLILFTLACGPVDGLIVGCAAGLIALIHDPYVIHPIQLLLDYPLASGAVAIAAFARPIRNPRARLVTATILGYLGAYIMAVLSGAIFFGEYAWEGWGAWTYSFAYNITYAGPECLITCVVVAAFPGIMRLVNTIEKGTKQ